MSKENTNIEDVQNSFVSHFDLMIKSKDNDIITVDKCRLCQSKLKEEAHKKFDETNNIAAVCRLLKEKGEVISHPAVSNHINNHYRPIQEKQNLYEYGKKLQKWGQIKASDVEMFNRYITMLDMEAMRLSAENQNLEIDQQRKNLEIIIKISQQIVQIKEMLKKSEAEKRPVQIIIDSLNRIISIKLEDDKSPEVKQALKDVVDQLLKDMDLIGLTMNSKEE